MYLQKNIKLRFILTPIFNAISLGKKIKHKTKYDYDKNGNLISETDWLGNRISYVYDSLNRVIEKKDQYNKQKSQNIVIMEHSQNQQMLQKIQLLINMMEIREKLKKQIQQELL